MNILSLLSAMLATAFFIGGVYCLTRSRKMILNVFSFLVLLCLGWWSLCNAFLFSAETEAELWRWHHLAAIGWTGFISETTYYFIILTGFNQKMKSLWKQLAFYALPLTLMLHNVFGGATSLATGFVRSGKCGQWAYVNSVDNVWLWLFLGCLIVYFGFSFFLLLSWSSKVRHRLKRRMARWFVVLDALTILLGFGTDVLLPLTGSILPSVANLSTALFGFGYFLIIIHFDLFNVHLVVSDREILEHAAESIFVTDEDGEILYCNRAGAELFETEKSDVMGCRLCDYLDSKQAREHLCRLPEQQGELNGIESPAHTEHGADKQLLISAAAIRDEQREYLGTVISLRDITQLAQLREQYRIKSDEYQRLAFVDTLTGLPNRRMTFETLSRRAEQFRTSKTDFFVLYMDLDNFKSVNDRFGHDAGDRFLRQMSERLASCLSAELDFLGRLSGDEFLMIGGPNVTDAFGRACAKLVKAQFAEAFQLGEYTVRGNISLGFARYSDFMDIDVMVHHADEKMYTVKQKSHSRTRNGKGATEGAPGEK